MSTENNPVRIAVASGKGGTGKSCVSSSLVLSRDSVTAVDADVEEPNLSLLLDQTLHRQKDVTVLVPEIDPSVCTRCGKCSNYCLYGALTQIGNNPPLLNKNLCHNCGVCSMVCPPNAITEIPYRVGEIRSALDKQPRIVEGRIDIGTVNSIPVIKEALREASRLGDLMVIDCPPGTSCPVVACMEDADFVLLVTEPTPFGLSDLEMALELATMLKKDCGIIVNRSDLAGEDLHGLSERYNAPILASFPFSRNIAEAYAQGISPIKVDKLWEKGIGSVWEFLEREVLS
ncbi:MAG: ATP-binding protein [Synergistales bacterium]|nr:ATP-binding protein [Synergistales bacterium]